MIPVFMYKYSMQDSKNEMFIGETSISKYCTNKCKPSLKSNQQRPRCLMLLTHAKPRMKTGEAGASSGVKIF